MKTIELTSYYPHLTERIAMEVSDEIAVTLSIGGRLGDSYKCRKRERGECSLDGTPGFEADVTRPPLTPEEIMEQAEDHAALYAALDRLPPIQARRVYARFILGRSVGQIAKAEGVNKCQITRSIGFGLKNLREILKNLS
ncbi:RNA polymerase sigma factor [[Clostridium] symbiosum]|uniref:RNA polymerase sigma factor n=1 Tax=Clostridium symbiosum TaxID=1512 RepID=UPI0025A346EB|nr:sigma-70 family RNA polymerase sigma factor [[Clostridium] symbiosum]MDM8136476.1 sigma-70 family RNA polymerase sigma factor [[Clostridium] symbiosum]MDM8140545.1 sigma-70 family RNA polymerase sigma factor [[Clostridium] symbiosum]MDM8320553.1 sigma-70 family RNA polymerase sigma factor [[Clostridium] symbiosum]